MLCLSVPSTSHHETGDFGVHMSFCRPLSRNILQPLTRGTFLKSTSPSSSIAVARTFASVVPDSDSTAVALENTNNGASRPHLNIPVDPNHGLYGFFRKTEKDGVVKYETIDAKNPLTDKTGACFTVWYRRVAHSSISLSTSGSCVMCW